MSRCKHATGARLRPRTKASAATKTNPFNICPGIICSCGKMCKDSRGLKIHQAKTKCQMPENTLKAPPKKCFVSLNDVILSSCLSFEDKIYYQTSTKIFIPVSNVSKPFASKQCFVKTTDIIITPLSEYLINDISPCRKMSCQTCNQFISNQSFKSNLTGKEYKTTTYDKLSCGSSNIIYVIHCIHCGLVYVGEIGRSLRSRMNGHRSAIKKGGQSLLHSHLHQPNHSVDDMRMQILEKIYHSSGSPSWSTPLRRERELFSIKELGTAKAYGFNDQIKGVGTLGNTSCKKTNVYTLFNKHQRQKRSHGKRHYNKKTPQRESSIDALITIIDMIDQPEGVHKIKTHLFSMSLPQLSSLQEIALESTKTDFSSPEYRVTSIILGISHYRLFKPVKSDVPAENPKHFMKIKFLHKGIDAINLPQLLRSQSVMDKIPAYFKDKEPPIISYQYTNTVANKLFNFSSTLSNLDITNYLSNPQHCQCNTSKFRYEPHGHLITGDLMVIENVKLRKLVAKGPKYREPNKINWQSTKTMISNATDLYVEQWSKREQVDLKYLSEWKDQIKEF